MSEYNHRQQYSALLSAVRKRAAGQAGLKRYHGVTLIELLIVLAIVAILLMVASPNYDAIISGSKVDETRLGLATSLALARTEAIKRGESIRVCRGTLGDCSGTSWNSGWEVLRPNNEVLQVVQQDSGDASVSYPCGSSIAYLNSGARSTMGGECVFTISKNGTAKTLSINATGRVRMN